jgi:hypothetical protein
MSFGVYIARSYRGKGEVMLFAVDVGGIWGGRKHMSFGAN